jgi:hypothetical protein
VNALYNLARVTTATTGTGAITLGSAVVGYLTFAQAGVPNGAIVSYAIADGANSEAGSGVYSTTGPTLTRNVYRSTGAGNNTAISLSGAAQVFITALAEDFAGLYSSVGLLESDGAGNITAATPGQDYALPAWDIDLDFTTGVYWAPGANVPEVLTCSRASVGYIDTVAGVWSSVAANTLRRSDKGALIEEARTNSIRNNSMTGAVAGTPGTLPSIGWAANIGAGVSRTIVGIGTQNGIDYIDIRISGSSAVVSAFRLFFELSNTIAAATGQAWSESIFLAIVGGTTTNITSIRLGWNENTSAGGFVRQENGPSLAPSLSATLTRFSLIATLSGGGTVAAVMPALEIQATVSAAIDITLRIGWPQMEQGGWVTSPIRTTSAAATRAADVVTLTAPPTFGSSVSAAVAATPNAPATTTTNQQLLLIDDGTTNDRLSLLRDNIGNARWLITDGGANQAASAIGAVWAQNAAGIVALAAALNNFAADFNGSALITDSSGTMPIVTTVRIGASAAGVTLWNGYIRRVLIWPETRLGNALVTNVSGSLPQAAWIASVPYYAVTYGDYEEIGFWNTQIPSASLNGGFYFWQKLASGDRNFAGVYTSETYVAAQLYGGGAGEAVTFYLDGATPETGAGSDFNAPFRLYANAAYRVDIEPAGGLTILGTGSGGVTVKVPAVAGSNTLTLPAGTTDFSATGGASQVVRQSAAGGPLTVGQLAAADILTTATNDNAAAGKLGEYQTAIATAIALTSPNNINIVSISLTAGDWDVEGSIKFNFAATTTSTVRAAAVTATSGTMPTTLAANTAWVRDTGAITTGAAPEVMNTGTARISLAATTTIYLVGGATFATSTCTADGFLRARRVR